MAEKHDRRQVASGIPRLLLWIRDRELRELCLGGPQYLVSGMLRTKVDTDVDPLFFDARVQQYCGISALGSPSQCG